MISNNVLTLEVDGATGVEVDTAPTSIERNLISGSGLNIIAILIGLSEGNGVTDDRIALSGSGTAFSIGSSNQDAQIAINPGSGFLIDGTANVAAQ